MEILFFIVGICVFALGCYTVYDHIMYVRKGMHTTGTVTGFDVSKSSKSVMYAPVISSYFGEFTSDYGSNYPSYGIGEQVEVLYIPDKKPRIKSNAYYFIGVGLMAFGGIFCLFFIEMLANFSWPAFLTSFFFFLFPLLAIRKTVKSRGIDSLDELKEKYGARKLAKNNYTSKRITAPEEIYEVRTKNAKTSKRVGVIFAVVGVLLVALGSHLMAEKKAFLERSKRSTGVVVDFIESSTDDGVVFYPYVEYSPLGSYESIYFQHDVGSSHPSYSRDQVVDVLYDPENHNDAIIDSGLFNWFGPALVLMIGGIFALVGFSVSKSAFSVKKSKTFYQAA